MNIMDAEVTQAICVEQVESDFESIFWCRKPGNDNCIESKTIPKVDKKAVCRFRITTEFPQDYVTANTYFENG